MVSSALRELVQQLAPEDKAELRSILDDDLVDFVPADLEARLSARWVEAQANPDDYLVIDDDERELRTQRLQIGAP